MNNLTGPFLPRGVLIDNESTSPLEAAEPFFMAPREICVSYWRPRLWRLSVDVEVGFRSFIACLFKADVLIIANNRRRPGGFDFNGVPVPPYSIPQTELDLVRTAGTEQFDVRFASSVRLISELPPPDGPFDVILTGEGSANLEAFTKVVRHIDGDNWRRSTFKTFVRGSIFPLLTFADIAWAVEIGGGDSDGLYAAFNAPFSTLAFTTNLRCQGLIRPGPSVPYGQTQVSGSASITVEEYWPYAARDGTGPKFDKQTGLPLVL